MDYIIILAGGKGLRMGTDIPKQFLPIGGLPVLMHTVKRFREYSKELNIILVLPKQQQEYWQALCDEYQFMEDYTIADGGETRFHSIKNGLKLIPDDAQGLVGVHDGVRPFPSVEVIRNCYETARKTGSAIPVIPVVETIRHLEGQVTSYVTSFHDFCHDSAKRASTMALAAPKVQSSSHSEAAEPSAKFKVQSSTVPRDEYRLVQTPQVFDIQLHKKAYAQDYRDSFTDDASVVESMGCAVTLVEGNRENIKITTPFDCVVAEAILSSPHSTFHTPHSTLDTPSSTPLIPHSTLHTPHS
jgi:2-C-methyl-D-erythritol 4-phosphate cytidylyltransferase